MSYRAQGEVYCTSDDIDMHGSRPPRLAVGDFDGDGRSDLLLATGTNSGGKALTCRFARWCRQYSSTIRFTLLNETGLRILSVADFPRPQQLFSLRAPYKKATEKCHRAPPCTEFSWGGEKMT
jgi:hypothetical protein